MRDNPVQAALRDRVHEARSDPLRLETISIDPLDDRIKEAIQSTGIAVFGSGKCGKTNLVKVISSQLHRDENIQLKIFDKAQNWVHEFEEILYQDLDIFTLEREGFYFGDQPILYNCRITNPKDIRETISEIVGYDYDYHWELKEVGEMDRWIIYVVEEAQNVLGSVGTYDIWNTFISEGRNFNMAFIFVARRMAQVSTKARENMQSYIWGRMFGENNMRKVKAIAGKDIADEVESLPKYEFIYYQSGEAFRIIDVPLYQPRSRPVRWNGNE